MTLGNELHKTSYDLNKAALESNTKGVAAWVKKNLPGLPHLLQAAAARGETDLTIDGPKLKDTHGLKSIGVNPFQPLIKWCQDNDIQVSFNYSGLFGKVEITLSW